MQWEWQAPQGTKQGWPLAILNVLTFNLIHVAFLYRSEVLMHKALSDSSVILKDT